MNRRTLLAALLPVQPDFRRAVAMPAPSVSRYPVPALADASTEFRASLICCNDGVHCEAARGPSVA